MKKTTLLLLFIFLAQAIYAQQPYYDDVDLTKTGLALRDELAQKIIETHTNLLEYSPGVWEASRITDVDPNDNSKVLLLYGYENGTDSDVTNDLNRDKYQNGGQVGDWNREHTYPKSLGNPNLGESGPGSDAHHLRPTDVQRNGARGNRKFAAGSGNSGTVGENWYPGDAWKGDVARMLMYMYLHYGERCLPSNVIVGSTNGTDGNMIDLLLQWNAEDPVSAVEDQRNAYHDSDGQYAQGNRNPFIDNPYLATAIWGGPEAEDRWGTLGIASAKANQFKIYPNPAHNTVNVSSTLPVEEIRLYDISGRLLETYHHEKSIDVSTLHQGVYVLDIQNKNSNEVHKLMVR
tara:strand:- start:6932 stop:7972 length:1041 start_codon:yes stop_codon:yes gene_type:complete